MLAGLLNWIAYPGFVNILKHKLRPTEKYKVAFFLALKITLTTVTCPKPWFPDADVTCKSDEELVWWTCNDWGQRGSMISPNQWRWCRSAIVHVYEVVPPLSVEFEECKHNVVVRKETPTAIHTVRVMLSFVWIQYATRTGKNSRRVGAWTWNGHKWLDSNC